MKNRRTRWVPLVLRWRRRDLKPIVKTKRMVSRVSLSYVSQIHLHVTTFLTQSHRSSVTKVSPGADYRERMWSERRFHTRMKMDTVPRPVHARPSPINYVSARTFSKHTSSNVVSKQIHQPDQNAFVTSVFTSIHRTRRAEVTKVLQRQRHSREHRSQVFSFHSAQRENLLKTERIYFDRAEELFWRRTQSRTTVSEDAPVANVTQTTPQQTVRFPAVSTHVQSASAPGNQPTPQQITKLDPGLLDRLTDDVIRRVEKRARIERERRGL